MTHATTSAARRLREREDILPAPGVGIVGGVVFGLGALLADRFIPVPAVGARETFAALVHDSREAFGWHEAEVG